MWLINVESRKLHSFEGSNIPPYAILSHRWEDDEISFQEMQDGVGRERKGYKKIAEFCDNINIITAKAPANTWGFDFDQHDGAYGSNRGTPSQFDLFTSRPSRVPNVLSWVWVDTCCIDKRSSAELSEAINSMYAWYQNAEVCCAFLSDVTSTIISGLSETHDFSASVWFTRGWTLQELLAPSSLIFVNKFWDVLGTKLSLVRNISSITGISPFWLTSDSSRLNQNSIEGCPDVYEKLHWASTRKTTRVEDRAYCMLGLFGVNMPLLYGEGERAFHRLQEEILKQSPDLTLLVWSRDVWPQHGSQWIMARSPEAFQLKRKWTRLSEDVELEAAPSLSSRGLSITLELWPIKPSCYLAPLAVSTTDDQTYLAIMLVYQGSGRYRRCRDPDNQDCAFEVKRSDYIAEDWQVVKRNIVIIHQSAMVQQKLRERAILIAPIALTLPYLDVLSQFRTNILPDAENDRIDRNDASGLHGISEIEITGEGKLVVAIGYTNDYKLFCLVVRSRVSRRQAGSSPLHTTFSIPSLNHMDVILGDRKNCLAAIGSIIDSRNAQELKLARGDQVELCLVDHMVSTTEEKHDTSVGLQVIFRRVWQRPGKRERWTTILTSIKQSSNFEKVKTGMWIPV